MTAKVKDFRMQSRNHAEDVSFISALLGNGCQVHKQA
jgi:hypothetical protein